MKIKIKEHIFYSSPSRIQYKFKAKIKETVTQVRNILDGNKSAYENFLPRMRYPGLFSRKDDLIKSDSKEILTR